MEPKGLPKTLGLGDVFCIAVGAMISAGIFLLPAAAYSRVGPAIAFSYVVGGVLATCGILAVLELATAMPQAGGIYYFTTRALGPLAGTMSGLFNWAALSLKSAFAIWGTAQLAHTWVPAVPAWGFGVGLTLAFLLVNLLSTSAAAKLEQLLVYLLLAIMAAYVAFGLPHIESARFTPWLREGVRTADVFWAAGFIFVSFGGLLGVISVAEEVRDPRRNLPLGILAGLAIVTALYGLVMSVTIGAIEPGALMASAAPLADAARGFRGLPAGYALLTAGALLAYVTTGNAGLMGAARYPVALARDGYAPALFAKVLGPRRIPAPALLLTGSVVAAVQFMGIETLVTVASTVVMLSYILTNLSVIILRESRVMNYRPSFRTPLYPALPLACMAVFVLLVVKLGDTALGMVYALVGLSLLLYFCWGLRVKREFALQQLLRRLFAPDEAAAAVPDLERELRDVVRSRDGLVEDAFDRAVKEAPAFVETGAVSLEGLFRRAAAEAAPRLGVDADELAARLLERERLSSTAIAPGVAVPHIMLREGEGKVLLLLAKCEAGVPFGGDGAEGVRTAVFLFCTPDRRDAHLRGLAMVAQAILGAGFERQWARARTSQQLRDVFLLARRTRRSR